jgi:hypothetical protein
VIKRLAYFVGGSVTFWVLVAIPARHLWGGTSAVYAAVALLLCLVPTSLTLLWAGWASGGSPEQQITMVLGGTGIRMFVVLAGAFALSSKVPYFQEQSGFWAWVLVFYLFTLALEVFLVLSPRGAEAARPSLPQQSQTADRA